MSNTNDLGGWTPIRDLTAEDKKIFQEAVESLLGVKYVPGKVQTQIVYGINYKFLCHATILCREPVEYDVIMTVYKKSPEKNAIITSIVKV